MYVFVNGLSIKLIGLFIIPGYSSVIHHKPHIHLQTEHIIIDLLFHLQFIL